MLNAIEQRVLGVLIEKELTVPDSYPMTENTLLAGCNQKSNRDPEMALSSAEVADALVSLRGEGWVTRIDGSGRTTKYRHNVESMLGLSLAQKAILCELLVRGPQAPGALKPRIARMGATHTPAEILDELRALADRHTGGAALVEQHPKRPRERDSRWGHCLGPGDTVGAEPTPQPETRAAEPETAPAQANDIEQRVAKLEAQVVALSEEVYRLRRVVEPG